MTENTFLEGFFFKLPHDNAPDFVKGSVSMKREEVIKALQALDTEWVNLDLKVSKEGKAYAQINDWKPEAIAGDVSGDEDQDLPF